MPIMTKEEHEALMAPRPICSNCGKPFTYAILKGGLEHCPYCGSVVQFKWGKEK